MCAAFQIASGWGALEVKVWYVAPTFSSQVRTIKLGFGHRRLGAAAPVMPVHSAKLYGTSIGPGPRPARWSEPRPSFYAALLKRCFGSVLIRCFGWSALSKRNIIRVQGAFGEETDKACAALKETQSPCN